MNYFEVFGLEPWCAIETCMFDPMTPLQVSAGASTAAQAWVAAMDRSTVGRAVLAGSGVAVAVAALDVRVASGDGNTVAVRPTNPACAGCVGVGRAPHAASRTGRQTSSRRDARRKKRMSSSGNPKHTAFGK